MIYVYAPSPHKWSKLSEKRLGGDGVKIGFGKKIIPSLDWSKSLRKIEIIEKKVVDR